MPLEYYIFSEAGTFQNSALPKTVIRYIEVTYNILTLNNNNILYLLSL